MPLRIVFANGAVLDGADSVAATEQSPIFTPAKFPTGETQYGDATLRGSFWSSVSTSSPNWHVLLGFPTASAQTVVVPQNQGRAFAGARTGKLIGEVDDGWLVNQESNLLNALHVDPGTLAVFLTHDVFTYTAAGCCIYGEHGVTGSSSLTNGNRGNTWIFAAYTDAGLWPDTAPSAESIYASKESDVLGLGHEVAEWLADPDITNVVPSWHVTSGISSLRGCVNLLEVGDPLDDTYIAVKGSTGTTYHVQDVAFLSWFARTSPSTGYKGRYSLYGTDTSPSQAC